MDHWKHRARLDGLRLLREAQDGMKHAWTSGRKLLGLVTFALVGCHHPVRDASLADAGMTLEIARGLAESCLRNIGIRDVKDQCMRRVGRKWVLVLGAHFPVDEIKFVIDHDGTLEGYYFECAGVFLTMNSLGPAVCGTEFNVPEYCAAFDANPPSGAEEDLPRQRCL